MNEIIKSQVSLLSKNTWGINSIAEYFADINNFTDLINAIQFAKIYNLKINILGLGSNILLPSEGLFGLTLQIKNQNFQIVEDKIILGAGNILLPTINKLTEIQIDLSLLAGIPGTIGGAICGNAGANNINLGDFLIKAEIIDLNTGKIETWLPADFKFSYRYSALKNYTNKLFWQGTFNFTAYKNDSKPEIIMNNIKNQIKLRVNKQPSGKTAGSTFKNPINSQNWSAGYLIEQSGLKGFKIGDAQISEQHANFFINLNKATSDDLLALINLAKFEVKAKFGIELEPEVQLMARN